jgi:hypothetical protein
VEYSIYIYIERSWPLIIYVTNVWIKYYCVDKNTIEQCTTDVNGIEAINASRPLYNILYYLWLYNELFIILYNILKTIAESDCCQIIILSIYVPSTHAYNEEFII